MQTPASRSVDVAPSLPAALEAHDEGGSAAAPFAGGTWIMRAPIRHEPLKSRYVAIEKIPELHAIKVDADVVEVGAAVTRATLAATLAELPAFDVLTAAASRSVWRIREWATVVGKDAVLDRAAGMMARTCQCRPPHGMQSATRLPETRRS
ncbi:FAD binding domain-containing protein [Bradyrhizobium diversitatis]|uniref:FAD binding domain-containing protein n=1 Tax=Bradyrhizobium diversitatis TaxID=2755406 RepID=A0ABS0NV09_9BRAD|nr:FAD binding domain-containing protein [Bradyrhizobium diversitatis]MBH5384848.1 FAD binding domain-containing protein [Bradyrhizobium diversitatis]